MFRNLRLVLFVTLLSVVVAAVACGGGDENEPTNEPTVADGESGSASPEPTASDTPAPEEGCGPVEEPTIEKNAGTHYTNPKTPLSADDFSSNPPAGGRHTTGTLTSGQIYTDPVHLGDAVHSLEHGAVIFWTNNLPKEESDELEAAANGLFSEGYTSLVIAENPEMDVPFAISAWGYVQKCTEVDPVALGEFTGSYYASGAEGFLACSGAAAKLPMCKKQ